MNSLSLDLFGSTARNEAGSESDVDILVEFRETPSANPKRPGRQAGDQYGQQATRVRPDPVDETIVVDCPLYCEHCQGKIVLEGEARQYQIDLPEIRPWTTEFILHYGKCSECGREAVGRHPRQTSQAFRVGHLQLGPGVLGFAGADFLLRLNWQNLPLQSLQGEAFDLFEALRQAGEDEAIEFSVQTAPTKEIPAMPARLVVLRKSPEAAEEARRKLLKEAKKKGRAVNPRTLEAAAYFFVLTSVSAQELTAAQVLELYRFRWQIEMAFKRFKEILPLRQVPAKDPDLPKTYLLGNLLVALLTEDLARSFLAFSP